jgi:KaiC/GvpD/RAD55 family RecA-like ATPase
VLRGQLDVLGAGRGSVVLVAGPAGAGKTMLLAEAASLAADRGSGFSVAAGIPRRGRCRSG